MALCIRRVVGRSQALGRVRGLTGVRCLSRGSRGALVGGWVEETSWACMSSVNQCHEWLFFF